MRCECCGRKKKQRSIYLPPEMSLAEAEKRLFERQAYENKGREAEKWEEQRQYWSNFDKNSERYIDALNGAREMRHDECPSAWETEDYDLVYLLNKWWKNAHNYSDPALPRVYGWGKFHAD